MQLFTGGVNPAIQLAWYNDSTCNASTVTYAGLGNVPVNYPDTTNSVSPGAGGNIGYTAYRVYVAADSLADELCEGKRQ
ncbi:MAG: hypothetical protein IPP29_23005 [Bacteroidetes bacterium]|nr:hypothetical protein [Bacteroidota bacterium]